MTILFEYFLLLNVFGFAVIAYDKYLAKKHKRRIPEKILLAFVLFGGTIGSGLAMLTFRHKTSKRSYLSKFWSILFIQIAVLYLGFHLEILNYKI